MKTVVILGCGPAGLFAAHAAEMAGFSPMIISKKRKSEMYGAQYLHAPIPGVVEGEGFDVSYRLDGTIPDYAKKVYGPGFRGTVSPDDLTTDHKGWDIRAAYDLLWRRYQDGIQNVPFENSEQAFVFLKSLRDVGTNHFISTIPAPTLCVDPMHSFQAQRVWALGDAPERGVFSPITLPDDNTVVCSGLNENSWYRVSRIQGFHTVEWPDAKKPPLEGVAEVLKPIATNCDCLPWVHRLGRYGKWTKGVLSHEAFYETEAGLASVSTSGE